MFVCDKTVQAERRGIFLKKSRNSSAKVNKKLTTNDFKTPATPYEKGAKTGNATGPE